MHVERPIPSFVAVEELLVYVRLAGRGQQCGQHVLVGDDAIQDRTRLDLAWPADETTERANRLPSSYPSDRGRVLAPSGQVSFSGPLSVEYMTMVLSAIPNSSSLFNI